MSKAPYGNQTSLQQLKIFQSLMCLKAVSIVYYSGQTLDLAAKEKLAHKAFLTLTTEFVNKKGDLFNLATEYSSSTYKLEDVRLVKKSTPYNGSSVSV